MKFLKYIMLILIIAIIITTIILIIIYQRSSIMQVGEESKIIIPTNKVITKVSVRDYYYEVKNIIERYYTYLTDLNKTEDDIVAYPIDDGSTENTVNNGEQVNQNNTSFSDIIEEEKQITKKAIYSFLSKDYIAKNGITVDNIQEKLGNYKDLAVIIDNMYSVDAAETVKVYFVYGKVIEKETKQKTEFAMMITVDLVNKTYEIVPSGFEYDVQEGKELIIDINEIEKRTYNIYKNEIVDNETYCKDLMKDYKNKLIYDIEGAYNSLDEEYRKAKFKNIEEFEKYVENNYNNFKTINVQKYAKENKDGYVQYVLEDRQKKEYIFNVSASMKYTVILDTYTIDIPEFIQKYQQANTQEKVVLNINKFMMAINDKDYKYAYSILADSFKNKNFSTLESFETYAKQNFFEGNEFEYGKFDSEGDTYYTYAVTISDSTGQNTNTISKTFIIRLNEGTDFEISFNI